MRIVAKQISDYPSLVRRLFWNQKRKYGQVLDPTMPWFRSPLVFLALSSLFGAIDATRRRRLPPCAGKGRSTFGGLGPQARYIGQ